MKYLKPVVILVILTFAGYFIYQNFSPKQGIPTDIPVITKGISGCNQIYTNLQEALKNPSAVCKLDLSSQGLKTLSSEIGKMENLQEFYVQGNALTDFPAEVGRFKKLTILNLSNNQISGLPAEIGHLSNLQELNLSSNRFDAMPQEFVGLKNLKKLNLSNNNYKDIPNEIYSMTSLEELSISGNKLTPDQINTLKQKLPGVVIN